MDVIHSINGIRCENCSKIVEVPKHCGQAMHLEGTIWVCHKGEHAPCCGRSSVVDFDPCCDDPSF